jgi:hypothetical protein
MSEYETKRSTGDRVGPATIATGPSPGKRTLVEQAYPAAALVQRRSDETAADEAGVHAAAARGTATPASALPHGDWIQRAFGRHDVSSVQAHAGGEAAASASAMGAQAYATGNHIVLGGGADLFTEAHEAAHVVQQRGGVQLKGGVGEAGDPHERHADEVAALVVQGKSAEGLLDRVAGPATARSADVQRQVQRQPVPGQGGAVQVGTDLQQALDDGRWNESIRPRMYKQLSAPAVQRAAARRKGGSGAPADLTGVGSIASIDQFVSAVKAAQAS